MDNNVNKINKINKINTQVEVINSTLRSKYAYKHRIKKVYTSGDSLSESQESRELRDLELRLFKLLKRDYQRLWLVVKIVKLDSIPSAGIRLRISISFLINTKTNDRAALIIETLIKKTIDSNVEISLLSEFNNTYIRKNIINLFESYLESEFKESEFKESEVHHV